ncbi:MAG: transposase [Pseudomonadota bacterium]
MTMYAGLDVSDKSTHICVVDGDGTVLRRDVVASDPEVLAKWLVKHCADLARVVLETGPLSTFLYHGLVERAVPIDCICARHAKGVFAARVNKSDVHDAEGLAQLARTGWFKRVHMKASATHIDRAALRIRAQLITTRVAMGNQLRGLLKLFGLRLGAARTPGKRRERLIALYQQRPDIEPLFAPLVASMEVIEEQLRASNRLLESRAEEDPVCSRLMSVPGVGPITALTSPPALRIRIVLLEAKTWAHTLAWSRDVASPANAMSAGISPKRGMLCYGDRSTKPRTSCCVGCSDPLHSSNGVIGSQNLKATNALGLRLPVN